MRSSGSGQVTELLDQWREGDRDALERLMSIVYDELQSLARRYLRRERPNHSLQATDLTHEAFLRLVGQRKVKWQNRAHFFAIAAQMMRRVLVEHARKRQTAKRGADPARVTLIDKDGAVGSPSLDVLAVHEALERLAELDERQSQIVELRYFGGLTVEEVSDVLGASPATVKREWKTALLWLKRALEPG